MYNKNQLACKNCKCKWEKFNLLTNEQLERINSNRFEASYKAGEIIFKQGSPTSNAIFLTSGIGKIYMEGYDGKNIILELAKPGRLIIGPGTYVDNRHHYTLAAIAPVSACFVKMDIIKELVLENSEFAEGLLKDMSFKSLQTFNKLINFNQKKMHGRLAEGLIKLSENIFEASKFKCLLSRQEIGEYTGMTKESVVRLLKEFHDEGIIKLSPACIEIVDKQRLEKIMISG